MDKCAYTFMGSLQLEFCCLVQSILHLWKLQETPKEVSGKKPMPCNKPGVALKAGYM